MDSVAAAAASLGIETSYTDALGRRCVVGVDDLAAIVAAFGGGQSLPSFPAVHVVRGDGHANSSERSDGTLLLRAPQRAYQPDFATAGRRVWLIVIQLYAIRSRRNWGIGDFTDLANLLEIAAEIGAAGIALNPLHALFVDRADQASPYAPNSRLFLNPLYIDVDAIPEYSGTTGAACRSEIERLRRAELVDYSGVAALKLKALQDCFIAFRQRDDETRVNDFEAFRRERGQSLRRYAVFEVLRQRLPGVWWDWPLEWRTASDEATAALSPTAGDEIALQEFIQWIADRQLMACVRRARDLALPVGLYLDVAVGVEPGGADAWCEQRAMVPGYAIGAPPDILNPNGQNWGLASFNPAALVDTDFDMFRRTLRAVMRYAGAIRIDHVLGLNRLFLIPNGRDASHGTYVRFPLLAMLAIVAQESVAARCLVIGEDLGTVPEGLRETLADWGLWSYRLMMFEHEHDHTFKSPSTYPREALVAFNTHDLPSFAGWNTLHDFAVKHALGVDPGESADQRRRSRRTLKEATTREGIGAADAELTFLDVACFLARTPSGVLAVAVEDIFESADQINIPGTMSEHPNWRRRWPIDLEDFRGDQRLCQIAAALTREGRDWRRQR